MECHCPYRCDIHLGICRCEHSSETHDKFEPSSCKLCECPKFVKGGESAALAVALESVLSRNECRDLVFVPIDVGIGYAFTLLIEKGIDDPEAFLREQGVLE